jgi:hypothetical protein
MFPLSLGILAAGLLFLCHWLFAEERPGSLYVNPGFSVIMMVAGGFGLYAGCLSVYRRLFPAPPAPPDPRSASTGKETSGGRMPG